MKPTHIGFRNLCQARNQLADPSQYEKTVAEMARDVGISHYHFIRQFDALFGVTPHQFRLATRLERARQMLAADHASVTDISLECGWESLGSFSYAFTNRFGISPLRFRQKASSMIVVPQQLPVALFPGCLSLMASLPPNSFRNS